VRFSPPTITDCMVNPRIPGIVGPQLVVPLEDALDELADVDVLPEELDVEPDDEVPPVPVPVPLDATVPWFPVPPLLVPEPRDPLVPPDEQAAARTKGKARRAATGSR